MDEMVLVLSILFSLSLFAQDCVEHTNSGNSSFLGSIQRLVRLGNSTSSQDAHQNRSNRDAISVCRWQAMSIENCTQCLTHEKPVWDEESEVNYRRGGLIRAGRNAGAVLISGLDRLHGYDGAAIESIVNELPKAMAQFEDQNPELAFCAPIVSKVAKECAGGNFDVTEWLNAFGCNTSRNSLNLPDCIRQKCPQVSYDENISRRCEFAVPRRRSSVFDLRPIYKLNGMLLGLYQIKNEDNSNALLGETSDQRLARQTVNHVMNFLKPMNEFPERIDSVMTAFERGGTNCYGYSLVIKSALRYTAQDKVEVDIIKQSSPAHAWNRIRLKNPQIEFDIDGSTYDTSGEPQAHATQEFFPLPPRNKPSVDCRQINNTTCESSISDTYRGAGREVRSRSSAPAEVFPSSGQ